MKSDPFNYDLVIDKINATFKPPGLGAAISMNCLASPAMLDAVCDDGPSPLYRATCLSLGFSKGQSPRVESGFPGERNRR